MKIETMGDRVLLALKDAGISQAELSRRSGVDQAVISRLVRGERETGAEKLQALADHLEVNLRWLLVGEGDRRRVPTPGRAALDDVLRTMDWPSPINIEAADAATVAARAEADRPPGSERAGSVWTARLLQLYREACAMPEGLAAPIDSTLPPSSGPPPPPPESKPQLRPRRT